MQTQVSAEMPFQALFPQVALSGCSLLLPYLQHSGVPLCLLHNMPPTPFLQPHESPGSYSLLGSTAHPGDAASLQLCSCKKQVPGGQPLQDMEEKGATSPAVWSLVPHTQESYTHAAGCAPRTWSVRVKQLHRK